MLTCLIAIMLLHYFDVIDDTDDEGFSGRNPATLLLCFHGNVSDGTDRRNGVSFDQQDGSAVN